MSSQTNEDQVRTIANLVSAYSHSINGVLADLSYYPGFSAELANKRLGECADDLRKAASELEKIKLTKK